MKTSRRSTKKPIRFLQCQGLSGLPPDRQSSTRPTFPTPRARALMNLQTPRLRSATCSGTLSICDAEKFPTIRTGCAIAGHLTEEAAGHLGLRAGIPVSVGGGNGMCASVGAGVASIGYLLHGALIPPHGSPGRQIQPFFDAGQPRFGHICSLDGQKLFRLRQQCAAQAARSTGRRRFLTSAHASARSMPPRQRSLPAQTGLYLPALSRGRALPDLRRAGAGRLLRYDTSSTSASISCAPCSRAWPAD